MNSLTIKLKDMKFNKTLYLIAGLVVLMFTSCDPVVDEMNLSNSTTVEGVELVATQSTPGGNKITLDMTTPGVTGYWNYNLGKALTDRVTFIYPIPGKATFTFVGTLGAEFFEKTIDVQIDVLDNRLDQDWYDLVSENTAAGKSWEFDKSEWAWWYMAAPGDPANWASLWWDANNCCAPGDADGRLHFDLDGAANVTYYSGPGADGVLGNFVLDVENKKLDFNVVNVLGADAGNTDGIYDIVELTEDRLILYESLRSDMGTGWTWIFRPVN